MSQQPNSPDPNVRSPLRPLVAVAAIAAVAVAVGAAVVYIVPGVRNPAPSASAGAGYPPPPPLPGAPARGAAPGYAPTGAPRPMGAAAPAACYDCGVVVGVRRIQVAGHDTGLGAVAGGLLGGVLGNQMGEGNGRTAMTVVGALGGALAGNTVEKRTHEKTEYQIDIHMDNGRARTIRGSTPPPFGPGTRVRVDGDTIMPLR